MKAREYSGPLGILAAGAIGLSLLCGVSTMAMGDLSRYIPITLEPISFVDFAVANLQTAAAMTEQAVTAFVPTATLEPSGTPVPASLTPEATETQRRFVTITPTFPRRTRAPLTATAVILPSRTPTSRPPTRTPTLIPSRTRTPTPRPTSTHTPLPPPTLTNTPIPPDTATSPPDTATSPPDTATSPPTSQPDTATPEAVQPPTQGATQASTAVNPASLPSPTPGP